MPRTNAKDVQELLGKDWDGKRNVNQFIITASVFVNRLPSEGVPTDELKEVEKYLAAWAYCMSDRRVSSHSSLGASQTFQGQTGMALDANEYGQMAKMLDRSGHLVDIVEGEVEVKVIHLGHDPDGPCDEW